MFRIIKKVHVKVSTGRVEGRLQSSRGHINRLIIGDSHAVRVGKQIQSTACGVQVGNWQDWFKYYSSISNINDLMKSWLQTGL